MKTLVMEDDAGAPLVVLMHGDREVSTKALARQLGRKTVQICRPDVAQRHCGYLVGGTSPSARARRCRSTWSGRILALPKIYVNGGSRGFLVGIAPADLVRVLSPMPVDVAIEG